MLKNTGLTWNRLVIAVGVGILLFAVGSLAVAAPVQNDATMASQKTILDPFSLQTVTVSARQSGGEQAVNVTGRLSRPSIRIPSRPPMRSAYRPMR